MTTENNEGWSVNADSPNCGPKGDTSKCEVCQASWLNGQLYWSTGKQGRDIDLAGLVCNRLKELNPEAFEKCANHCKGLEGGDTWENRAKFIEAFADEL